MKTKKQNITTTLRACASMLRIPLFIVSEAKACGSPAFKSSGRVDVDELKKWIANDWYPMPPFVFHSILADWKERTRPTLATPLGTAASIEEASRKTGLSVSMIAHVVDRMRSQP